VQFGKMLGRVIQTKPPAEKPKIFGINYEEIRRTIESSQNGYLKPSQIQLLLDLAEIPRVQEFIAYNKVEVIDYANEIGFPIVMKVIGPIHKTEVEGVRLNIQSINETVDTFNRLMAIEGAEGVLIQKMLKGGLELFVGAKREENFGHIVICGIGGIYIEVLKDIAYCLAPCSMSEAEDMIKSLKAYKLIEGVRGKKGIHINKFKEIIVRLSTLLHYAPEIYEIDINPLIGCQDGIFAVDSRINIIRTD
jgi:acetyltransferase